MLGHDAEAIRLLDAYLAHVECRAAALLEERGDEAPADRALPGPPEAEAGVSGGTRAR